MKIQVRHCRYQTGGTFAQQDLPLVPHAIPVTISGETTIEIDEVASCGHFEARAMVFVVPDGERLVLSGVGIPRKTLTVRLMPPEGATEPTMCLEDLDPYQLRLELDAINNWWASRGTLGGNFRLAFPELDAIR
ncbi:MAG: hypothetical protein R3C10_28170 [Pirellulales bacterium]